MLAQVQTKAKKNGSLIALKFSVAFRDDKINGTIPINPTIISGMELTELMSYLRQRFAVRLGHFFVNTDPRIAKMAVYDAAEQAAGEVLGLLPELDELTLEKESKSLPGMDEIVMYPCDRETCEARLGGLSAPLRMIVMHLNDAHHWPRHRIADWLESLDIDLEFK